MNNYAKYLRKVQKVYFEDVVKSAFPKAKCKYENSYWEHYTNLPFHIDGTVKVNRKEYQAIIEYYVYNVKGYEADYGLIALCLYNKKNDDDSEWIYVNPVTLDCSNNFNDTPKEDEFWKNLAYWAENFKSERYTCPCDGETSPDLLDVMITHFNNK